MSPRELREPSYVTRGMSILLLDTDADPSFLREGDVLLSRTRNGCPDSVFIGQPILSACSVHFLPRSLVGDADDPCIVSLPSALSLVLLFVRKG